jgi:hypothetical protein
LSLQWPVIRQADSFMPQNQWRHPAFIMAMPRVHIRPANAAKRQINNNLFPIANRGRHVANF